MPTIPIRGHEKLPDDFQSKPSGDKSSAKGKTVGKVEQVGSSVKPSAKSPPTAKSSTVVPASLPNVQDTQKQKTASAQLANAAAEVVAKRKTKSQQVPGNQDVSVAGASAVSSKKPASSEDLPSFIVLDTEKTAQFKSVTKEKEFSNVQTVSEEAFNKMSHSEKQDKIVTVKFDKENIPIHYKIEDMLKIGVRLHQKYVEVPGAQPGGVKQPEQPKPQPSTANDTLSRLDYPNVLRDMILDTIPTGKASPKDSETSSKEVETASKDAATSPVPPENRPGTRDDILNWNPTVAPSKTAKEKNLAETNLRHDLELQKSLLLKLHPDHEDFVKALSKRKVSLGDQVLRLRRSIHKKLSPEYASAIDGWDKMKVTLQEQVNRLDAMKKYAFGSDKWEKYYGKIAGEIPQLTDDLIQEVLFGKDAEEPDKSIMDTHVLVLVPEAVEVYGKRHDISIESLGVLAKQPKEGSGGQSTQLAGEAFTMGGHEKTVVERAHWVLMRKEPLKDSERKKYEQQQDFAEYNNKAGITVNDYDVPDAVDAVACCLLTFISTGIRLFNQDWKTRTRQIIEDVYGKRYVAVGQFGPDRLIVDNDFFANRAPRRYRVVPARTFYGPQPSAT